MLSFPFPGDGLHGGRVTRARKRPAVVDRHSGTLLGAGGVLVAAGGAFVATAALEPSKTARSIWVNSWFDTGFACLIAGLVFTVLGVYLNYHKQRSASADAERATSAPMARIEGPARSLPPLLVRILPDSRFQKWRHSVMIAALHVAVENTTDKDIQIEGYEFVYSNEGLLSWDYQVANDEHISALQEIKRRDENQENGKPLRDLGRISAGNRISGWLLTTIPRNPAGGTPECTIVILDDIGNRYTAKLPRQEPRTYGPITG